MLTRARLAGLWILGSVISPAELEHLDDYSNAIDGQGGTYAPTDPIVIGGDGVTLSGANHHVSGTLTVDNLAVISIASGGTLKAEGTSTADITLKVVAGVALLDVESGAAIRVKSGGALDVFGALTFKDTSGPGSATWEDNTTAIFSDGSTCTHASGSTTTFALGSDLTLAGDVTTSLEFQSGSFWTGILTNQCVITNQVKLIHSGSAARQVYRAANALSGSADADITVAYDRYTVPSVISANRQYTIRHTGTVPATGERIKVTRMSQVTPSSLRTAKIVREDATILFSFYAGNQGFAEFEFDGTDWQLIAGAQYASGAQSGYYDDVW